MAYATQPGFYYYESNGSRKSNISIKCFCKSGGFLVLHSGKMANGKFLEQYFAFNVACTLFIYLIFLL